MKIVAYDRLTMSATAWPSYASQIGDVTILEQIHCTDSGERAELSVNAHLTDGTVRSVTSAADCDYITTDETIIKIESMFLYCQFSL